jgi:hypothetical protein
MKYYNVVRRGLSLLAIDIQKNAAKKHHVKHNDLLGLATK